MTEEFKAARALAWETMRRHMRETLSLRIADLVTPKWDHGRETSHIIIDPKGGAR